MKTQSFTSMNRISLMQDITDFMMQNSIIPYSITFCEIDNKYGAIFIYKT